MKTKPAFPTQAFETTPNEKGENLIFYPQDGMTLFEYTAIEAMKAILSNSSGYKEYEHQSEVVSDACDVAEAMINELEKHK